MNLRSRGYQWLIIALLASMVGGRYGWAADDFEVLYFGLESGVNRTGAPSRVLAQIINRGPRTEHVRFLKLSLSEGLTLLSEPENLNLADRPTGQYRHFYWEIIAEQADIPYEITLQLTDLGDLDGDGIIGTVDLATLSGRWLSDFPAYDISHYPDHDGHIDLEDFAVLARNFGQSAAEHSAPAVFSPNPQAAPASYVPEPQPVATAIDVCSYYYPCWYEPQRWDPIRERTPIRRPLLGYYDETNIECVDWQIKWAVENGITCFLVDWYWDRGHQTYYHWFNAYKQAQYRDYLKVAIMWANHNPAGSHSLADMENVTNEWINNYFHLPTYFKIDGKPAVFIWAPYRLWEDMGFSNVKIALDNSRAQARAAGYKGIYFVGMMNSGSPEAGFDARTSYNEFGATSGTLRDYQDVVDTSPAVWRQREVASTVLQGIPGGDFSEPYFASGPSQSFSGKGSWVYHTSWANAWVDIVGSGAERHAQLSVNWYPRVAMLWWDAIGTTPATPWKVYADLMANPAGNRDVQRVFALGTDHNGSYDFSLRFDGLRVDDQYAIHWTAGSLSGTFYSPTSIINQYARVSIHYTPETGHAHAMIDTETIFDVTIATGLTLDKVIFKNQANEGQWDTGTFHVDNVASTGNLVSYPVAGTGWDLTPMTDDTMIVYNRTPELFEQLLVSAEEHLQRHPKPFMVIGPMNEWGEGSYIEPCTEYGFGMYEAIRNVFSTQDPATFPVNLIPQDVGLGPYDQTHQLAHWNFNDSPQGFGPYMQVSNFRHQSYVLTMLNLQGGSFSPPFFPDNTLEQDFPGHGAWKTALSSSDAVAQVVNDGPFRYAQLRVEAAPRHAVSYWDSEGVSSAHAPWSVSADVMAQPAGAKDAQRIFALGSDPLGDYDFHLIFEGQPQADSTYAVHWRAGSAAGTAYVDNSVVNAWRKATFDYDPDTGAASATLGAEALFSVTTEAGISFDKIIFAVFTDVDQADAGAFNFDNVAAQTTEGAIRFATTGNDPALQVYIPHEVWLPDYRYVDITMQFVSAANSGDAAQLFWSLDAKQWHGWVGGSSFSIVPDNRKRTYRIDLSNHPQWTGRIDRLRFDPTNFAGMDIIIHDIEFSR